VSIEKGTTILDSHLAHTLVGQHSQLTGVRLAHSMLGNHVRIRDVGGSASLGDHAECVGVPE
jgi:hypothetical protein